MGGGDVKLAAYVGLITGFPGIITALVVTILAGGIISFVLLLLRVVNLRSGIPYVAVHRVGRLCDDGVGAANRDAVFLWGVSDEYC